ncbi:MAG TPA: hypothetical protein VF996_00425 [Candidatus Saccharimonadales bacterium]|jgi:hypothetical protein
MLKIIYSLFLGIILSIFAGVGISAFYQSPEYPEPPESLRYELLEDESEQYVADQRAYDLEVEAAQGGMDTYQRNVSIIATVIAVIFLAVGLIYAHKIDVIADGFLLGGIFTLLYSMGLGLASGDEIYRFLIITVGVVVAIGLGYWRFAKDAAKTKKQ